MCEKTGRYPWGDRPVTDKELKKAVEKLKAEHKPNVEIAEILGIGESKVRKLWALIVGEKYERRF